MIRIAVCDDDAVTLGLLKEYLSVYQDKNPSPAIYINYYSDPVYLLNDITRQKKYDIYILDILMPLLSGIELGVQIRDLDTSAVIIYLTSSSDYAVDAFKVRASGYIVKPVRMDDLHNELKLAIDKVDDTEGSWFSIKTSDGIVTTAVSAIMYGEWRDHVLTLFLADGRKLKSVTLRESIDKATEALLKDEHFMRPHKSFVVNMEYVKKIDHKNLIMWDEYIIPVAQSKYTETKKKYSTFFKDE